MTFEVVNQVGKCCEALVSPSEFVETRVFPVDWKMCNAFRML